MDLRKICGHSYIENFLGAAPSVLDCGANHGVFSSYLARNQQATVYGFEPDPRLFPKLPDLVNARFFNMAVSGSGGDLILNLGEGKCSSAYYSERTGQASVTVTSTKISTFCSKNKLNKIDLLKLDIEGAELEVLEKLPDEFLAGVGQITVEFHDFLNVAEIPRIRRVVRRLQARGFYCMRFSYHDYSDCLFINTNVHCIGLLEETELLLKKYWFGLKRMFEARIII